MNLDILEKILSVAVVPVAGLLIKALSDKRSLQTELLEKQIEADKEIKLAEIQHSKSCCELPKITEHDFFGKMKCLRDNITMSFELQNKGKELIFKDLLATKIDTFGDIMYATALELDGIDELNETVLRIKLMDAFREGIKKYSTFYMSEKYTLDEQKIYSIVMPKFNKWHNHRIQIAEDSINQTCSCVFFPEPKVKVAAFFDRFFAQFIDTVQDAESTLNELNGDLKGLTFRGVKL